MAQSAQPLASSSQVLSSEEDDKNSVELTKIEDDLTNMGIDQSAYPYKANTQPQFISLVEWAYDNQPTAPDDYNLYLYIVNQSHLDFKTTGTIHLGFPIGDQSSGNFTIYTYQLTELDRTDDNGFIKYKISNPSDIFTHVFNTKRRYLISSIDLTTGTDTQDYPLGQEIDYSGYPANRGGNGSTSTLKGEISDFKTFQVATTPVVSTMASQQSTLSGWGWNVNHLNVQTSLNYFSEVFALPEEMEEYGELQSVHYEYYKYRTNWILQTTNNDNYIDSKKYQGEQVANSNGDMLTQPNVGYKWLPLFDLDDKPDIDPNDTYDTHYGAERFFANNSDGGHHQLRVESLGLVYKQNSLDETEIKGKSIVDDIANDSKNLTSGLERMNGYLDPNLVYKPVYSEDKDYLRYGYNNRTTSISDLSGSLASEAISNKMVSTMVNNTGFLVLEGMTFLLFQTPFIGGSSQDAFTPVDFANSFKTATQSTDPEAYSHIWGSDKDKLLAPFSKSSYKDDFILSKASVGYDKSLASFLADSDNTGKDFYRLTYDLGLTNVYQAESGSSYALDGLWAGNDGDLGKTDTIWDFNFIDMTFKDESGEFHTLPISSHPDNSSGGQQNPAEDLWPWWVWVLIAIGGLGLIYVLFKFGLKGFAKVISIIVKVAIEIPYVLGIWWWASLLALAFRKDPLPFWPWKG